MEKAWDETVKGHFELSHNDIVYTVVITKRKYKGYVNMVRYRCDKVQFDGNWTSFKTAHTDIKLKIENYIKTCNMDINVKWIGA